MTKAVNRATRGVLYLQARPWIAQLTHPCGRGEVLVQVLNMMASGATWQTSPRDSSVVRGAEQSDAAAEVANQLRQEHTYQPQMHHEQHDGAGGSLANWLVMGSLPSFVTA